MEILMVPIHLDALYLKTDRSVVKAMADFTRLPSFGGDLDINPDTANLSEEILSQPFQDRSLQLKAGIHLHWALPDALTKGFQDQETKRIVFPAVPNRWLVTRTDPAGNLKQWIVESDYLYPPGNVGYPASISYPDATGSQPQRFRYLGRKMPLAAWNPKAGNGAQYLDCLTAVGYGEPTFAAFYPNCLSVFGFHDDAPPTNLTEVQYDVIGWYSNRRQDCLQLQAFLEASARDKYDALKDVYKWVVEKTQDASLPSFPQKTTCYAHLIFKTADPTDGLPEERKVAVAVGNTSTEALSAYLADYSSRDPNLAKGIPKPSDLEDQLEAVLLAGRLDGRQLDMGPKFREARHSKEFTGVAAGTLWTIRPESAAPTHADAREAAGFVRMALPPPLANQLHCLNLQQQAYDQDCDDIESRRKQLFADWYKYMLCAYPPEGNRDQYPGLDEVKDFVERNSLIPLKKRIVKNRALNLQRKQAVANLYQAVAELQLLSMEDIQGAQFQTFQSPRPSARDRIVKLLPSATGNLLIQAEPITEEAKTQLIADLNVLLKNPNLYDSEAFSNLLSGEAKSLLDQLQTPIDRWLPQQVLRFNRLLLEATFPENIKKSTPYALKPISAPRYWQPNEPVVLIVDEVDQTVKPTLRHGQDGRLREDSLLECHIMTLSDAAIEQDFDERHFKAIRDKIIELRPDGTNESVGFSTWTEQPWHPFLLEWKVELMALKGKYEETNPDQIHPSGRTFAKDCITENYRLDENAVDFIIQPGQETLIRESARYYGRSILTSHAKLQMLNQIKIFLEKQLLEDYYKEKAVKTEERTNDYFAKNIDKIIEWAYAKNDSVLNQILHTYDYLNPENDEGDEGSTFHLLAQSLSGFNEALLMQKQTLQLPIDDPLGFEDYQAFTADVSTAVGGSNRVAPQPHNDFNPIRTGVLRINQLRLVDTFGQVQTIILQDGQVITTDAMTTPANSHLVILPPRIVQPARINFRWLAADEEFTLEENDDPEVNSHPDSTPICGWLLPNNLDNSHMVYDAQGRALGALNQAGQWESAPGDHPLIATWPLPNPHLHKVVVYLKEQGPEFLAEFMTVVENALDNIDPESAAHHESLSLLMGRPIAVVRAMLNLELQGLPAIDQDWNIFQQDMERAPQREDQDPITQAERETEDFTKVEFPIRIGEYKQLNDGLVGYWIENDGGYEDDKFYAPQSEQDMPEGQISHPKIAVHREHDPIDILQSIDSPPHKLTLLMDPRGCVHATSGILPTKSIQIPAEHFVEALRNIEVMFLTAPILTDHGKINLSLPAEPGYVWSWLAKRNGSWDVSRIEPVDTQASFTAAPELREGWLKLTEEAWESPPQR